MIHEVGTWSHILAQCEPFEVARGTEELGIRARTEARRVELTRAELPGSLGSSHQAMPSVSSALRSRLRPRCRCVLTVPRGRPAWSAISASDSSEKKRSAITSR